MKTLPKDIIAGFPTGLFSIPEGVADIAEGAAVEEAKE